MTRRTLFKNLAMIPFVGWMGFKVKDGILKDMTRAYFEGLKRGWNPNLIMLSMSPTNFELFESSIKPIQRFGSTTSEKNHLRFKAGHVKMDSTMNDHYIVIQEIT